MVLYVFVGVWRVDGVSKNSILMSDHELPSETRCRRRDVATTVASQYFGFRFSIWQTQSSNTWWSCERGSEKGGD